MRLTDAQMRAIELNLEQQDRFQGFANHHSGTSMDLIVRKFYEYGTGGAFETMILNKIGALLTPESTEDLNLEIRI